MKVVLNQFRRGVGLALCLLLVACASSPVTRLTGSANPEHVRLALSGAPLGLSSPPVDLPDPASLLNLTPEMQLFAERAVYGLTSTSQRAEALHYALLGPASAGSHDLRYNERATHTPVEAFRLGEANCLSFSLLYVALARHVGVKAMINDVSIPPAWNREQGQVLFLRHVNVWVPLRSGAALVIDLDMQRYRSYYPQTLISDKRAKAQYYNNRAMEVFAEDRAASFYYMQAALKVDQEQSFIWNNLAALYRRSDHLDLAESLYLRALAADPWDLTVIYNLSQIYRDTEREPEAERLQHLIRDYQNRNPYYQYRLASRLYIEEDYQQAAMRIEDAIRRQPEERIFYQLAADIYERLGAIAKRDTMLTSINAL